MNSLDKSGSRRCCRGDMRHEDLVQLHERHARGLFLLARSVTWDDHLAEDVVQTTFLRLLDGPEIPGPAYLYQAVRNNARNRLRSVSRAADRESRIARNRPLFEVPVDRLAEREELERGLEGLAIEQREVVVLKVWAGLTYREVGEALGISPNTAASRYQYGIEHLRRALQEVSV